MTLHELPDEAGIALPATESPESEDLAFHRLRGLDAEAYDRSVDMLISRLFDTNGDGALDAGDAGAQARRVGRIAHSPRDSGRLVPIVAQVVGSTPTFSTQKRDE